MPLSSGTAAPRLRPWMIVAPVAALAATAAGLFAVNAIPLPSAAPIGAGDAVQISVIPPVEPEVSPGERMEVGDLVDGYDPALVPVVAPEAAADANGYHPAYASAWLEPDDAPAPVPRRLEFPVVSPTAPQPNATPAGNPYGFDAPGPDYDAARRARRERLDRIEADASARPPLDADTAFY